MLSNITRQWRNYRFPHQVYTDSCRHSSKLNQNTKCGVFRLKTIATRHRITGAWRKCFHATVYVMSEEWTTLLASQQPHCEYNIAVSILDLSHTATHLSFLHLFFRSYTNLPQKNFLKASHFTGQVPFLLLWLVMVAVFHCVLVVFCWDNSYRLVLWLQKQQNIRKYRS